MSDSAELIAANEYIEAEIKNRLCQIEKIASCDVVSIIHPMLAPIDDIIRDQIEDIKCKMSSVMVILETNGGSIETTERIADVLHYHYPTGEVSFLIPNFAMSAGTVLVMSGDRILMDYYSVLGPIDPQIRNRNNQMVPALGYLEMYNNLIAKSAQGTLTGAELAFLIEKFDPAELHRFEQAKEHSTDLLERWLVKYKFKNWSTTKTSGKTVTHQMKIERAKEIAVKLNDTKKWRSHGRGLSIEVIINDLNLLVEDFGKDPSLIELGKCVRGYYRLLQDYMQRRGHPCAVHTRERLVPL
jgi:hypothetical protein